ncbi:MULTISPECIES: DNA-processing protein DprA [unclassified Rhodosalinus]|uniref:DNA-processing protein DprA n=1 Tax=unclassified Rhodosalinus TaxID=2630183 RepID=UPI003523C24D
MAGTSVSSTHPPLPHTMEDDVVTWLRLLRSRRVGPTTFHRLMAEHGSAAAALDALPGIARAAGIEHYQPCPPGVAQAELAAGHAAGARLLRFGQPGYPAALADLPDAPPALWAVGRPDSLARPLVALVGARNASSLGTRMARALARGLGEAGYAVVSGLARGVDTAAHHAALETGTIAVLAGGVDVAYPSENAELFQMIGRQGLRLSEQPPGRVPQARHFPARNRIISGLARAVVVVEAAARSGSLITARAALDQGREVLAVPGHPFDARAAGCNMLIRDGARLVRRAEDVIEAIGLPGDHPTGQPDLPLAPPAARTSTEAGGSPPAVPHCGVPRGTASLRDDILDRLGPSPLAEDQLVRDLARPAAEVAPALLELELDGRIARRPGGLLTRT